MIQKSGRSRAGRLAFVAGLLAGAVAGTAVLCQDPGRLPVFASAVSSPAVGMGPEESLGVRFRSTAAPATLPTGGSPLSARDAVERAITYSDAQVGGQLGEGITVGAAFGYFSDDEYAKVSSTGEKTYYFQDRPSWLVTFSGSGLNIPSHGPGPQPLYHHEQTVVIDASTGERMETYTYR